MRVVSLAPFRIADPDSGGRRLIFDGARQWAATCESFQCFALITLRDRRHGPVPFPYQEFRAGSSLWLVFDRLGWLPKVPYLRSMRRHAPRLARAALRSRPDLVEVHGPWLASVRRRLPDTVRVVLVMQNVETAWYEPYVRARPWAGRFRRLLARMEAEAMAEADHIVCLTELDRRALMRLYRIPSGKIHVIPPGFHPPAHPPPANSGESRQVIFVSSGFHDGAASARRLIDVVAPRLDPGLELVVAGSVCGQLRASGLPAGVRLAGYVPDLDGLIGRCRAMLNADQSCAGINMKVLAGLGAGIPVISTPEGARGYEDLVGGPIRVGALDAFPAMIRCATPLSGADRAAIQRYAWPVIGARRAALYEQWLQSPAGSESSTAR